MKRVIFAAFVLAALPRLAAAQVEKQVEVTKAYVPRVEGASKLPVEPDMTDTTRLRPEIDYSITPLSLRTSLTTRPIRPATVTYWEFNRPLPFYLKAGAGYPLNSVLDFYATTQNPSTGYLMGVCQSRGALCRHPQRVRCRKQLRAHDEPRRCRRGQIPRQACSRRGAFLRQPHVPPLRGVRLAGCRIALRARRGGRFRRREHRPAHRRRLSGSEPHEFRGGLPRRYVLRPFRMARGVRGECPAVDAGGTRPHRPCIRAEQPLGDSRLRIPPGTALRLRLRPGIAACRAALRFRGRRRAAGGRGGLLPRQGWRRRPIPSRSSRRGITSFPSRTSISISVRRG